MKTNFTKIELECIYDMFNAHLSIGGEVPSEKVSRKIIEKIRSVLIDEASGGKK